MTRRHAIRTALAAGAAAVLPKAAAPAPLVARPGLTIVSVYALDCMTGATTLIHQKTVQYNELFLHLQKWDAPYTTISTKPA